MKAEVIELNKERNVTLTCYLQDVGGEFGFSERPAMLVLPGGGYTICSDREADAVALSYSKAGYQSFILRYTLNKDGRWPLPLEDYEQAMDLIENKSEEWKIAGGKTSVVGFSAGGHLAACAATIAEHKPAAAILVYPAILKDIVDMCQTGNIYPNEHVDGNTCPCFLVACRDDRTVDIKNTLMMEQALAEHGIPFESHIYSYGGHGFSTGDSWIVTNSRTERLSDWTDLSIGWLKETLGELTRNGIGEPDIGVSKNGDTAPVLSVACSLKHIRKQNEKVQKLLAPMYEKLDALAKDRGFSEENLMRAIAENTIREIMETLQIDSETIRKIDKTLHGMPALTNL